MVTLRALAVALGCLLCGACGAHGMSLYPAPDASSRPYTAIDRMRATLREEPHAYIPRGVRPAATPTSLAYAPPLRILAPLPSAAELADPRVPRAASQNIVLASSSASQRADLGVSPEAVLEDDEERFACTDGSVLDVSYSADRRRATARWSGGDAIALTRDDDESVPTFRNGSASFRHMGPRLSWSDGEDGGETRVTVAAGDTLSKIALARYGSFDQVAAIVAANAGRISDPNLIFPGQVLVLPGLPASAGDAVERSCRRTA
jgi:nucleoid-associated protein YgaU